MQGKAFNGIGLMVILGWGAIALPSWGQDLNAELNDAFAIKIGKKPIAIASSR